MSPLRPLLAATPLEQHRHGPGFSTASLRGLGVSLDPFLNADIFRMAQPYFPPHPHAGFSAVTWMFPDGDGGFVNRDSLGDRSIIGPGAMHWTLAGSGVVHEEVPETRGVEAHGIQLFVNLPASKKLVAPTSMHLDAGDVPVDAPGDGVTARVFAGRSGQVTSRIEPLPPVTLLDVRLAPNAEYRFDAAPGETVLALGWDGGGTAGEGSTFGRGQAVVFERTRGAARFKAGATGLRFHLLAGQPLGEPVVFRGPFAMSDERQAKEASIRYQAGEMGALSPSF